MGQYVLKRILLMIPVLLGVSLFIFAILMAAPGDPAKISLGDDASAEQIEQWHEAHGLNRPFIVQWADYMWKIITKLDFGDSYRSGKPVTKDIFDRYPTTIKVGLAGALISTALGIGLGILSAVKQYSFWDTASTFIGMLGVSMPSFFTASMLIYFFSLKLRWLPASGTGGFKYYVLPVITISFSSLATLMRMTRSSMLEVARQDYIRTARAKGQVESKVIFHHQLKNAMIPIITVLGGRIGMILGGSMIVEQIFAFPGVGKLNVDSLGYRDYPMIRANTLLMSFIFGFVNLLIDVLYAMVDPRIYARFSGGKARGKKRKESK